ncbi:MAG: heparan-alpha-glucosaminide N-acetyltransferase [Thermodesulfobacteriota bacterium]
MGTGGGKPPAVSPAPPGQDAPPPARFPEVDLLRGTAVLAMVISNFLFDLSFFVGISSIPAAAAAMLARLTAGAFLTIAGVSLVLRRRRLRGRPHPFLPYLRRGGWLILLGMLVSVATWVAAGQQFVVFGVLHCIGVATLLAYPLLAIPWLAGLAGLFFVCGRPLLALLPPFGPWLIPLGIAPTGFASVDYVPLVPWAGWVFLGVWLGSVLYPESRTRSWLPGRPVAWPLRLIAVAGRHSLLVYFVHQPLLLGGIWVVLQARRVLGG